MKLISPLRYPGGKASISDFVALVIKDNELEECEFYEPYAGGAGVALDLLSKNIVSSVRINDADIRIFAFWWSILWCPIRLIDRIYEVPLTVEEWHRQSEICKNPDPYSLLDIGFAAFYMNRCNRSGIITGAGPIGGYDQTGKWKIGARFYRDTLANRIIAINSKKSQIHLTNQDAVDFLKTINPDNLLHRAFVYLDPPYIKNGPKLYSHPHGIENHKRLAKFLNNQPSLQWIASYDDTSLVRELYLKHLVTRVPVRYSLQNKRIAKELLIAGHRTVLPEENSSDG